MVDVEDGSERFRDGKVEGNGVVLKRVSGDENTACGSRMQKLLLADSL